MIRKIVCFLLIFFSCIQLPIFAQSTGIKKAWTTLSSKSKEKTFSKEIIKTISSNISYEDSVWLFQKAFDSAENQESIIEIVNNYANLLELAGDYFKAIEIWELGAKKVDDKIRTEFLLNSALCNLYTGNFEEAKAISTVASFSNPNEEQSIIIDILNDYALFFSGQKITSFEKIEKNISSTNNKISFASLYLAYIVSSKEQKEQYLEKIKKSFPNFNLFSSILLINAQKSPSLVIGDLQDKNLTENVSTVNQNAIKTKYFQIGSYKDEKNAKLAIDRAKKSGIIASYKQNIKTKNFIVYVTTENSNQDFILTLKTAGFEPWELPEKP